MGPGQERAISLSFFLALPRASPGFRTCGHGARYLFLSFFLSRPPSLTRNLSAGLETFAVGWRLSHTNIAFISMTDILSQISHIFFIYL